MIDPLGRILTEIRDDTAVAALVDGRVRGGEPAGKTASYEGDALGPGEYKRFVVLVDLARDRQPRLPVQEQHIGARCYGLDYKDAAAVAGAVSDAIHAAGPRLAASGIGIYGSFDESWSGASADPDTRQPHEDLVIRVVAADRLVTG